MSAGLLIVTAVPAEAEAVRAGLSSTTVTVAPVGVGPAAAGAGTARLLALAEAGGQPYQAVISAGIGGGFPNRVALGTIVLATRSIAADLGAESPEGFLPLDELGFGPSSAPADPALLERLREALPRATVGAVITCSTVTGTSESARALAARYPDAVAEAMEGYGVATAASQAGVPFAELRTISNPVGPRDRGAWRITEAFEALRSAAAALR
ncbi:futalosine hydrolase [Micromonospora sp. NBC_01796]|uniref:futalosine hydrolase n=1 Tax=Micromonospora sp. NBC_01796 TaxID=2975987 RepID=UPI002DDB7FDA|nr:futalosine hydrolase [Micromonospora sp. NBC_01796]WSA88004.1 futalosine hydrolase [Micromonospora sp. NBC_01796]